MAEDKNIEEKLKDEIEKRTEITDQLTEDINVLNVKIRDDLLFRKNDQKRSGMKIQEQIEKLSKMKEELIGYTLQIIAIVVAILAVVMTLSFLSTDYYKAPEQFIWMVAFSIIYFCFIFTLYVYYWKKRNDYVLNSTGVNMTTHVNNNSNDVKIDVSDWLQFLEHKSTSCLHYMLTIYMIYFAYIAIIAAVFVSQSAEKLILGFPIIKITLLILEVGLTIWIILYSVYGRPVKIRKLSNKLLEYILVKKRSSNVEKISKIWQKNMRKIDNSGWFEK